VGLFDFSCKIIARLVKAHGRQKDLIAILEAHRLKLADVKVLIETVEDEDTLQTPRVMKQILRLHELGRELKSNLNKLDPANRNMGTVASTAHQFFRGDKDEKAIADIMRKIDEAKTHLCLKIQVAHVGLTNIIGNQVLANTEVINKIDQMLVRALGEGNGLRIARIVSAREVRGAFALVCS